MATSGAPVSGDGYSWQKHSSGFVEKMAHKMGLTLGRGLGKNAQGMVDALDVKVRPRNMGMGYNNFQETTAPAAVVETKGVLDEIAKPDEQPWMKKRKRKRSFVSAEELLSRQQQSPTVGSVVDMTGPQVRVVTDMRDLISADRVVAEEEDTPMPELKHNLGLLVDLAASEVQEYASRLRHMKQTWVCLGRNRKRLHREVQGQAKSLDVMLAITSALESIQEDAAAGRLTLDHLHRTFSTLNSDFPHEFKQWNLGAITLSHVVPRVAAHFQGWQPLLQPFRGVDVLVPWMPLLQDDQEEEAMLDTVEADACPYTRLLVETVLPYVNQAMIDWKAREPELLLGFLDVWNKVLSPSVLWEQLLAGNIVPKLRVVLEQLDMNPAQQQQQLELFCSVTHWSPLMPTRLMIQLLEQSFFPKWHHALHAWLASSPDFDEVAKWYQGWKSVLPQELLANERIRWQLNGALEMMNQAVEGVPLVMQDAEQQKQLQAAAEVESEMSLKEVLEKFAEEKDIEFVPKSGRLHQGLQVYRFGSISVAMDWRKQLLTAQCGGEWKPVSLHQLLEMEAAR